MQRPDRLPKGLPKIPSELALDDAVKTSNFDVMTTAFFDGAGTHGLVLDNEIPSDTPDAVSGLNFGHGTVLTARVSRMPTQAGASDARARRLQRLRIA